MSDPFDGIKEKLKRANQNILNLQAEIGEFFESGKYPVLPKDDKEILLKAIAYHREREIPIRFSVLAGEVVHHLRSCFDHVVWQFSTPAYRKEHIRKIEFPILETRPIEKSDISRYEGKIKGITNDTVRGWIEELQPYNAPDPVDALLLIIQKMDVIDKHREVLLCASTGAIQVSMDVFKRIVGDQSAYPNGLPAEIAAELERHSDVVPQVAFRNFGRRAIQPVVPGLMELFNHTLRLMERFNSQAT